MLDRSMRLWIAHWAGPVFSVCVLVWALAPPESGTFAGLLLAFALPLYLLAVAPAWVIARFTLRTAWATIVFWAFITPAMGAAVYTGSALSGPALAAIAAPVSPCALAGLVIALERALSSTRLEPSSARRRWVGW